MLPALRLAAAPQAHSIETRWSTTSPQHSDPYRLTVIVTTSSVNNARRHEHGRITSDWNNETTRKRTERRKLANDGTQPTAALTSRPALTHDHCKRLDNVCKLLESNDLLEGRVADLTSGHQLNDVEQELGAVLGGEATHAQLWEHRPHEVRRGLETQTSGGEQRSMNTDLTR